jgi:hypothetical protein
MQFFGWTLSKKDPNTPQQQKKNLDSQPKSFVPPTSEDGSSAVASGGYYGQYLDLDGDTAKTDVDLIRKYRVAAEQPECDSAIEDVVNEAIIADDEAGAVNLNLDKLDQPDSIKDEIKEEFDNILSLMNFNMNCTDIFRRWYVDGRLYYHIIVDEASRAEGIQELRAIDALRIRKVREIKEERDQETGAKIIKVVSEHFLYQDGGMQKADVGLKINKDAICYVPSGILDATRKRVLSPLHKAIKPVNQLRYMEDSLVIYRLARAPERRIFYIDVGNLPKGKAEEYLRTIMNQYRNKIVYDAQSGEIRDDRKHMSMLEDFWLPRREGGRGTEITTLPGGDNLGQIEDIIYFQKKLYRALNVPVSRMEPDQGFNIGKSSEISRDEIKFQKFVDKLRKKFSNLFFELLKIQLILKSVIIEEDWLEMREQMSVDFRKDNHFTELKDTEILTARLTTLQLLQPYVGKYYSEYWVRRNVLQQSDEEIDELDKEIAAEGSQVAAIDPMTGLPNAAATPEDQMAAAQVLNPTPIIQQQAPAEDDSDGSKGPPADGKAPKKAPAGKKSSSKKSDV